MISRCFVFKFHDVTRTTLFRFSRQELVDLPPLTGKRRTVGVYTDTGHSFISEDNVPDGNKRTPATGNGQASHVSRQQEGATDDDRSERPPQMSRNMDDRKGPAQRGSTDKAVYALYQLREQDVSRVEQGQALRPTSGPKTHSH